MEEKEYNTIVLEGTEYTEIDRINYNDNTYLFFSDLDNPENFCIRKLVIKNDDEYVMELESNVEFNELLGLFNKKYLD